MVAMKRITLILACVMLSLCCFGCKSATYSVFNYEWKLGVAILSSTDGATVVCVGNEDPSYPTASVKNVTLTADDSTITIAEDGVKTYRLTYKKIDASVESTIYEVNGKTESGFVTVSTTKSQGDVEKLTAVMSIGGYALYFYA